MTAGTIFRFWMPLAATWFMMATEHPVIAAVIARLDSPKENLAAYGVAFAFGLIFESPIIMIMSAATKIVGCRASYHSLLRFTNVLNALITLAMVIFLLPPVFDLVIVQMIKLPPEVSRLTYLALFLLLPWPAAIGVRRFYQGVLIRYGHTRKVAVGTVARLVSMALTCGILFYLQVLPGAAVGAAALSIGVVAEMTAVFLMAKPVVALLEDQSEGKEPILGFWKTWQFYYPLALTSVLTLAVHPTVTLFVGYCAMPLESLAVLPVVNSLVFIFRCVGLSYQEVAIALMGERGQGYPALRRFAIAMGAISTALFLILAFTPLAEIWFMGVTGLSTELTQFAKIPLQLMALMPALNLLMCWQRSMAINVKRTGPITTATVIEIVGIIVGMVIFSQVGSVNGAIAASLSFILGRIGSTVFLALPKVRVTHQELILSGAH